MEKIQAAACGFANVYLVSGPGGSILIDTGTEKYRDKVLRLCENSKVNLIVLTHGHFDHSQNAAFLSQALHCPVGIGEEDVPLLQSGVQREVRGCGLWGRFFAAASNQNIHKEIIPSVQSLLTLKDGVPLLEYGVEGSIVALSGHTRGSLGVLLKSGAFFVGDTMQNIPCLTPSWCFEDQAALKQSVSAIRRIQAGRIYCGHGRIPR